MKTILPLLLFLPLPLFADVNVTNLTPATAGASDQMLVVQWGTNTRLVPVNLTNGLASTGYVAAAISGASISPSQLSPGQLPINVSIGSTWAPPVTNGLICFTHPQSGFTFNGTNVAQWNDVSGLTNHLYQTNAAKMPTVLGAGDSAVVHFPNDVFAWSNLFLYLPVGAAFNAQTMSVFLIAEPSMNYYSMGLFTGSGLVPGLMLDANTNSRQSMAVYAAGLGGTNIYGSVGTALYGMVCRPNGTRVYRNEKSGMLPANSSVAVTGGVIGLFNGARPFTGNLKSVLVYNRALEEFEVSALRRWAKRNFQISSDTAVVVCDGDSICYGTASSFNGAFPTLLAMDGWRVVNKGIPSILLETLKANATNDVDTLWDPTISTNRQVVVQEGGSNDFATGLGNQDTNHVWTNWVAYHQSRKIKGWKTIAATLLPRQSDAAFETKRLGFNSMIRAQWTNYCDGIADVGADPIMGNFFTPTNTDWYVDTIHPSNRGYEVLAGIFRGAISGVIWNR